MDCKEFSNLLDAWLDGALPDADARRMLDHAAGCEACAAKLTLRQDCRRMDEEIQVPDSFSSSWRQSIREEKEMEQKPQKVFQWKKWAAAAAALLFVVGGTLASRDGLPSRKATANGASAYTESLAAPSSSAYKSMAGGAMSNVMYDSSARTYAAMETADMKEAVDYAQDTNAAAQAEKIIRSASFTVKTADYDADLQKIQDLAADMGGRVEYLSSNGDAAGGQTRSASLTLRIPAQRLDEFLTGAQGVGTITGMTQQMEDVSDSITIPRPA
jgi:anti-sigma factor RsiW